MFGGFEPSALQSPLMACLVTRKYGSGLGFGFELLEGNDSGFKIINLTHEAGNP